MRIRIVYGIEFEVLESFMKDCLIKSGLPEG